ncbi:MAG: hypothetical protein ACLT98_14185 [Eggerthellaceae bacterium]
MSAAHEHDAHRVQLVSALFPAAVVDAGAARCVRSEPSAHGALSHSSRRTSCIVASEARAERVPHHASFASVTRIEHGEWPSSRRSSASGRRLGNVDATASTAAPACASR